MIVCLFFFWLFYFENYLLSYSFGPPKPFPKGWYCKHSLLSSKEWLRPSYFCSLWHRQWVCTPWSQQCESNPESKIVLFWKTEKLKQWDKKELRGREAQDFILGAERTHWQPFSWLFIFIINFTIMKSLNSGSDSNRVLELLSKITTLIFCFGPLPSNHCPLWCSSVCSMAHFIEQI